MARTRQTSRKSRGRSTAGTSTDDGKSTGRKPPKKNPSSHSGRPSSPPSSTRHVSDSETAITENDNDSDGGDHAEPVSDPIGDTKRDDDEDGICIDLGSTYTCGKRGTTNLDLKHGQPTYRSAVQLSMDGVMGLPSPSAVSGPWFAILEHWKRFIGRSPDDPGLEADIASVPYAELSENGAVYRFCGCEVAPEEVAAYILGKYKQRADANAKTPCKRLVLTLPAYFSHNQKEAMLDVAKIAGFDRGLVDITTIPEPVAACLWRVERDPKPESLAGKRLLVFDIGGGTTDACVLRVWLSKDGKPYSYVVESTAGDNRLGGLDFDQVLLTLALSKAGKVNYVVDKSELLRKCKHEKEELSDQKSVTITISPLDSETKPETVDVTDTEFREACRPLFDRISQILTDVVADRFDVNDVHAVYLVGGSSSLPGLRNLVQEAFPTSTTELFPDGGQVVAAGGGLHAMDPRDVMDVLPRPIGIRVKHQGKDQCQTILQRNLQLPASGKRIFYTQEENQKEVGIDMFEGGHVDLDRNLFLGGFVVSIPDCAEGTEVVVSMKVMEAGKIEVTAKIEDVEESLTVTLKPRLDVKTMERYARSTKRRLDGGKVLTSKDDQEDAETNNAKADDSDSQVNAATDDVEADAETVGAADATTNSTPAGEQAKAGQTNAPCEVQPDGEMADMSADAADAPMGVAPADAATNKETEMGGGTMMSGKHQAPDGADDLASRKKRKVSEILPWSFLGGS